MALVAGICPKCNEYILLKENIPFLICPCCSGTISNRECRAFLEKRCGDKDKVHGVIADCIALEINYGKELPFMVLTVLCDNFPRMEEPAFLLVKLSDFDWSITRTYLETFSEIKSNSDNVPWAAEFLDEAITYRSMEFADFFVQYIENKLEENKKQKYLDKVERLRKEYTDKASNPKSTKLLFALYIASSIINVLTLPLFIFTDMFYLINISIAVILVMAEIGFMFLHNKVFGNRLSMDERERLFMVIFMCSLFFALGSGIIGSIYKI
jgi:hypothetical protein